MIKIWKNKKYSIKQNALSFGFVFVLSFALLFSLAMAKTDGGAGNSGSDGGAGNDTSVQINTSIKNPLGDNIQTIPDFIKIVIMAVLYVGVPIVALAIIYTGFLFISAQGNSEKLTKAKKALLYTLIGAVLLLGAFVIANAIQGTVNEIKKSA